MVQSTHDTVGSGGVSDPWSSLADCNEKQLSCRDGPGPDNQEGSMRASKNTHYLSWPALASVQTLSHQHSIFSLRGEAIWRHGGQWDQRRVTGPEKPAEGGGRRRVRVLK